MEKPVNYAGKKHPSRLRRIFKHVALGTLGTLMLAGAMEWTGYRALDDKDGNNIMTRIDPTCRVMTEGEKELAHEIFGDKINTDHIKVFSRPWFGFHTSFQYVTPNNSIYTIDGSPSDDFSKENLFLKTSFIHELTHVMQKQNDMRVILEAIKLWRQADTDYSSVYNYDLNQVKDFSELNIEQQAQVFEDFYANLEKYKDAPCSPNNDNLRPYAEILGPLFPSVRILLKKAGYKDPLTKTYNDNAKYQASSTPAVNNDNFAKIHARARTQALQATPKPVPARIRM